MQMRATRTLFCISAVFLLHHSTGAAADSDAYLTPTQYVKCHTYSRLAATNEYYYKDERYKVSLEFEKDAYLLLAQLMIHETLKDYDASRKAVTEIWVRSTTDMGIPVDSPLGTYIPPERKTDLDRPKDNKSPEYTEWLASKLRACVETLIQDGNFSKFAAIKKELKHRVKTKPDINTFAVKLRTIKPFGENGLARNLPASRIKNMNAKEVRSAFVHDVYFLKHYLESANAELAEIKQSHSGNRNMLAQIKPIEYRLTRLLNSANKAIKDDLEKASNGRKSKILSQTNVYYLTKPNTEYERLFHITTRIDPNQALAIREELRPFLLKD